MIIFTYFIHGIWWNDNTRLDLVKAIVDENRFEIDSYYNNTGDRSYYNGHYYSDKAPGQSFLSTPIYTLWKFIYSKTNPDTSTRTDYVVNKIVINPITGKETKTYEPINPNQLLLFSLILVTIFTTSLPSTLTVLLIYKISKFFTVNEKYRILVVITYGLGTLAFIYATIYFTHGLATFFVFFAFYLLFKLKQEKKFRFRYLILSGLFIGFAIVVDYTSILFALGLIVYIALSFKNLNKFLIFISTLFIATTPLLFYNYVILGDFSKLVYAYTDPDIRQDVTENLGFTGKINLFIVYRHLFDPYRGLLFYHPILLLSIIGVYYMIYPSYLF
jgi:4-amino-4-deoxy-L-arabinose transferase-like glycosyltransferase